MTLRQLFSAAVTIVFIAGMSFLAKEHFQQERWLLASLAVIAALIGLWRLIAPRSFRSTEAYVSTQLRRHLEARREREHQADEAHRLQETQFAMSCLEGSYIFTLRELRDAGASRELILEVEQRLKELQRLRARFKT